VKRDRSGAAEAGPFLEASHERVRELARAWAEANFLGGGPGSEEDDPADLVRRLGREGLLAHVVPRAAGGARERVQARDLCVIREELARGSALADAMFAVQALAAYPIAAAGSPEQRKAFLPGVARGKTIAAFALTEPQAGSDLGAIRTRARKRGGRYVLDGVKAFISNAGLADLYVVFAATGATAGGSDLSAFIVPAATAGLAVTERPRLLSPHPIGTIELRRCAVPAGHLLGKEGDGLRIALGTLDVLRSSVGAAAVGLAQRALEEALRYSRSRRQFGRPLAGFQATQFKLADMASELAAARLLVYWAAWAADRGPREDLKRRASIAKLYATEAAQRIVDQALQIHGAAGMVAGSVVERLYRDVRALRIYEGTSEIQRLIIARELLREAGG
jgi:acyl-CoA dehydrogenase